HTSTVRVACALLRHRALRHLRLNGQGLTRLSALSLHDALPISFLGGVSGAILAFAYYRAVTPEQFSFNVSIQLVAMVLVGGLGRDRKSTRLNSSHVKISYAVFCLKKKIHRARRGARERGDIGVG